MPSPAQFLRNVFALGMTQILTWISNAALSVLLPLYLGDVYFGKLTFALSFTALIGLVGNLGISTYLTKQVARTPERVGTLTINALAIRIPFTLLAALILFIIVNVGGYDDLAKQLAYVVMVGIVMAGASSILLASLQGLHEMRYLALSTAVVKISYAVLAGAAVVLGGGPMGAAVASSACLGMGLVAAALLLLRRVKLHFDISWTIWRAILLGSLPFFLWEASLAVYGQIDSVMLAFMTRDAVVGWYAAAYRIMLIPIFVPTVATTIIFPMLSAVSRDPVAFNPIARRAAQTVALLTIPMALGIMLLADKMILFFHYPESFMNSVWPMILLAPHVPLASVDVIIGTVLTARDKQRAWALTGLSAAVLNPLLNLAVIPYTEAQFGNGAIGAAAVTTLTEMYMMVVGIRLLPAGVFNGATVVNVLRSFVAGLCMAAVVWWTRDLPLFTPIVLGGLVYVVAVVAFGAVSLTEMRQARQLLQQYMLVRRAAASGVPS